jgi:hypothetical protein
MKSSWAKQTTTMTFGAISVEKVLRGASQNTMRSYLKLVAGSPPSILNSITRSRCFIVPETGL